MDHVDHFRQALQFAWASPDPSTQTGAIILDGNGEFLSGGYNAFPRDVQYSDSRWERPLKYDFIEHAERNAIFGLIGMADPYDAGPLTMYALWAACADCARAIIQAGIETVHTHSFYVGGEAPSGDRKDWDESIRSSLSMFEEAGVTVVFHDEQIMKPGEFLRFNGEPIHY